MKFFFTVAVASLLACLSTGCRDATGDVTVIPQGFSGKWSSVSVATARSCALAEGGVAYCWGKQLTPQADTAGTPGRVPGPQTFTQVSTAASPFTTATCGLASDGAAYCWGGAFGGSRIGVPRRVPSPNLTTWSTDLDFACGLTAGGEPYCWGDGLEITKPGYDGSAVPVLPGVHLTSLTLGSGMACGIDTAGATICLHRRYLYRFGPPLPIAEGFISVVVGSEFRCGLRSDGQALCSTTVGRGVGGAWGMLANLTPVPVPQSLAQLSAGGSRVCGLTADGSAYCWTVSVGDSYGGGGITTPVAVGGEQRFVQISVAETHACGLTADGALYCWGDNGAGELGNGSIGGSSDVPVRVSDPA
jgi:hypothetical protein